MWSLRSMAMLATAILCVVSTVMISVAHAEKPPIQYHNDHNELLADNGWDQLENQVIQASPWHMDEEIDSQDQNPNAGPLTLTAYPTMLDDGSDLVISYTEIPTQHKRDYIALSCGPLAHPNDYLMKQDLHSTDHMLHPLSFSSSSLSSPSSSVRFPALYMMRCTYVATYYNFIPKLNDFKAIGSIEIPMKESFNAPKHGHLSFTSQVDEMAVMFNSASNRTPVTEYGTDPQNLTLSTSGTSTTYHATDMCEAPANLTSQQWFRDPGYMHTVILHHLSPLTTYYYRFGNSEDGWSAIYSFVSRASSSSPSKQAKFLAYADMGVDSAPAATSTAIRSFQEVVENGYDHFLLHIGDISYARGHGHVWDQFFHMIESYATYVPYLVSIGNHEYDYQTGGIGHDPSGAVDPKTNRMAFTPSWGNYGSDSCGECSVPMVHRWHTPSNGNGLYWYSLNERGVHVIQLSSEHDWTKGSVQYRWLEEDLRAVNRQETPWIVLTAHRMMYTTQLGEDADLTVSIHFREEMEELLWKYRVNLILVGHQHSYERSCPVYKGECTKDGIGPVHMIVGSAGAGLEPRGFSDTIGKWSVSHVNDWGYLRVESIEEEMKIEFILNRNGVVYDQVTLKPWK